MNVYLAGTYGPGGSEAWLGGVLFDAGERDGHPRPARQSRGADGKLISRVNLLESFYYLSNWQVDHLGEFKRFMLDSGAYTLAISRKGALDDVELRDYVSRYAEFVATHDVTHYFEMDIDHVKGTDWVRRTTDMLEQETGKTPVPVWHPCRKAKGFEEMCERYPYVAIGTTDIRRQLAKSVRWFTDTAHRYGARIHGLGYTKIDGLERTGFDSVDSTAWLYGNRGGFVYEFSGRILVKHKAPPGKRLIARDAARHNFREWIKFSEYMETR